MKSIFTYSLASMFVTVGLAAATSNWPQWRGPEANGTAPGAEPPISWSETSNVKWRYAIPGYGASTPILWGDQVFILSAEALPKPEEAKPAEDKPAEVAPDVNDPSRRRRPGGRGGGQRSEVPDQLHRWFVISVDRATGKERWRSVAKEMVPHEGHHQDHGFASFTPVTDGERLYVPLGSRGIHCFDLSGKALWSRDLGRMQTRNGFGEGGSVAVRDGLVVVNWDHEGDDFIVALDSRTGEERWRKLRNEATGWTTPLIVDVDGKPQVVVNATGKIRAYDLSTGSEIWSCSGMTANAIPTPVSDQGVLFATSGHRGASLLAIRLGQTGDLSESDSVVWRHGKNTPYVPSPLLVDERIYLYSGNNAMLSVFDTKTGRPVINAERIPGMSGVYASPVSAGGRVYLLGRDGVMVVLKRSDQLEVLATNRLDDQFDASPALSGKELFLRGHKTLYCIAE